MQIPSPSEKDYYYIIRINDTLDKTHFNDFVYNTINTIKSHSKYDNEGFVICNISVKVGISNTRDDMGLNEVEFVSGIYKSVLNIITKKVTTLCNNGKYGTILRGLNIEECQSYMLAQNTFHYEN